MTERLSIHPFVVHSGHTIVFDPRRPNQVNELKAQALRRAYLGDWGRFIGGHVTHLKVKNIVRHSGAGRTHRSGGQHVTYCSVPFPKVPSMKNPCLCSLVPGSKGTRYSPRLSEPAVDRAPMIHAVQGDCLRSVIDPEQDSIITDSKFVESLQIRGEVLHRSAHLIRMVR